MAVEVILPRRGNSVETCLILEWKKNEGDAVEAGEALVEVESDKATFEVESPESGTLLKTFYPAGEDVPVLSLLALVGAKGEDVSGYTAGNKATPPSAATASRGKVSISPRARKLAEQKGVAYAGLPGSGPGGRILERDILKAIQAGQPSNQPAGPAPGGKVGTAAPKPRAETPGGAAIPVKGVRAIIAERMYGSLQSSAQFTLTRGADAQKLLALRGRMKSSPEAMGLADVTVDKMVLYAAAQLLRRFPDLNSHFLGDRILQFEEVHLGYAVDTPRGLMVPVIRSAHLMSLVQIAAEARRLQAACLEGKILPEELGGGTFTVSNMGMLGIESFTPIVNTPEVGILGVGGIELKALRKEGEIVFQDQIILSLTVNHQAVDGGPAARFLAELAAMLADFDLLLASSV